MDKIKIWVMKCQRSGNGKSAGRMQIEIDAVKFGPLAVHRDMMKSAAGKPEAIGGLYTVTHQPTGYAIQSGLKEASAKELAKTLRLSPLSDEFWSGIKSTEGFRALVKDPRIRHADACRQLFQRLEVFAHVTHSPPHPWSASIAGRSRQR